MDDGPTLAALAQIAATQLADTCHLVAIGEFTIVSEGHLSLRDVYSREYDAMGVKQEKCA